METWFIIYDEHFQENLFARIDFSKFFNFTYQAYSIEELNNQYKNVSTS